MSFEFDGPVRSYAVGISGWLISQASEPEMGTSVKLQILSHEDPETPGVVRCSIEASIGDQRPYWACTVGCIADIGPHPGDMSVDSCGAFIARGEPGSVRQDLNYRFAETILTGFDYTKGDDGWSGPDTRGFVAMADVEGRTFHAVVDVSHGELEVDVLKDLGTDLKIQSVAAFLLGTGVVRTNDYPGMLGGGVWEINHEGSKVRCRGLCPGGKVLIVVRTKSVVVERDEVRLRLSEWSAGGSVEYFWEWEAMPGHWHWTARASDELDWFTEAKLGELRVTVGNNTSRTIQLTLDGERWGDPVEPASVSGTADFMAGGGARQICGTFTDDGSPLPDPTFSPIKQGGG